MKINDLQEAGARKKLKEILSKDPRELNDHDIKFLRARRSYLSKTQKLKYSGVLYFSRPALYHELKTTLQFLPKFIKAIIIGTIITLIATWIVKFSGW